MTKNSDLYNINSELWEKSLNFEGKKTELLDINNSYKINVRIIRYKQNCEE